MDFKPPQPVRAGWPEFSEFEGGAILMENEIRSGLDPSSPGACPRSSACSLEPVGRHEHGSRGDGRAMIVILLRHDLVQLVDHISANLIVYWSTWAWNWRARAHGNKTWRWTDSSAMIAREPLGLRRP